MPRDATVGVEAGVFQLPGAYRTIGLRSLLKHSYDDYVRDGVTYLVAAAPVFQAALRDPQQNAEAFTAYRRLLERAALVAAFDPAGDVGGPSLRVDRLVR